MVEFRGILRWLPILGLWVIYWRNLSVHWSANLNYSYGWIVPGIGIYALWGRWRTRPEPECPVERAKWVFVVAALAFLPTWTFSQPNPDWSLIAWLLTAEVIGMTLAGIAMVSGISIT